MSSRIPWLLLVLVACSDDETYAVASFEAPAGLAVAGTVRDRLFISNFAQDTVQVVNLGEDSLQDIEFVYGPSRRFPLRIPAGRGPTDLASTHDRRYVVVLDVVSESLRLIDADRLLLVRKVSGELVELPLGPSGSRPSAMVASPVECQAPCAGRVFVTLAGIGAVLAVDVIDDSRGVALQASRLYAVGGMPSSLAVGRQGRVLFASDADANEIIRVDLESGLFERRDIGGVGGPIAVSQDGSAVLVGRPAFRDVIVLGNADNSDFSIHDSNPSYAPVPQCLQRCDEIDEGVCSRAHPADRALCETDDGLAGVAGQEYRALFLNAVPVHIVTLGTSTGHPQLSVPCANDDDETETRTYSEFALVTLLDNTTRGTVMYVALRETTGGPLDPLLVSQSWCSSHSVSSSYQDENIEDADDRIRPLGNILGPCPVTPQGRRRLVCLHDDLSGEAAGIVMSPGTTGISAWSFQWEGSVFNRTSEATTSAAGWVESAVIAGSTCTSDTHCPSHARCNTRTQVCEESFFIDEAIDLGAASLLPCETLSGEPCAPDTPSSEIAHRGDILEITSEWLSACPEEACTDTGSLDTRSFERRILAIERLSDSRSRLLLNRYLDPACFRDTRELKYRVRAGDQFLAGSAGGVVVRIRPGQRYGPGGDVGRSGSEMFQIKELDIREDLSPCERYDTDGNPGLETDGETPVMEPVLSRAISTSVTIDGYISFFRSGLALSQTGQSAGPAGRMPGATIVSDKGAEQPVVFISYSGSNTLLGFVPFDLDATEHFLDLDTYRIIR